MLVPKRQSFGDENRVTVKFEQPIIIPRVVPITNEKARDAMIKNIESIVRSSMEYRDYIKFMKAYIDMNSCHYFNNIKRGKKRVTIEIHHEPFSLYDITDIVLTKHQALYDNADDLMVAEEVLRLHYSNRVGLIPVSITPHELIHSGQLIVPLHCTHGNFIQFCNDYKEYIKEDYLGMLNEKIELSKKLSRKDLSILNTRYVYIDVDGFTLPQRIETEDAEEVKPEQEENN